MKIRILAAVSPSPVRRLIAVVERTQNWLIRARCHLSTQYSQGMQIRRLAWIATWELGNLRFSGAERGGLAATPGIDHRDRAVIMAVKRIRSRQQVTGQRGARRLGVVRVLLTNRAGADAGGLVRAQRDQLAVIARALGERLRSAEGIERTLITWRREQMSASLRFLDALDA